MYALGELLHNGIDTVVCALIIEGIEPVLAVVAVLFLLAIIALIILYTHSRHKNAEIIAQSRLLIARKEAEEAYERELRYAARHDGLTGIYNERGFRETTETLIAGAPDTDFILARFDILHFKVVNEMFGFAVGDSYLRMLADFFEDYVNGEGTYAHIDADQFIICLPEKSFDAQDLYDKTYAALNGGKTPYTIVPYFGIYRVSDRSMPISSMIDRTTLALAGIKGDALRHFAFYEDITRENLLMEQEIINQMGPALSSGQFLLYLQPQYSTASDRISGAEVLVRWDHPDRGFISPVEFIPVFENNGFVTDLDLFVWEEACKTIARWKEQGHHVVPLSVNISRVDIYRTDIAAVFSSLIEKYGLKPADLHLEITESAYVGDAAFLAEVVEHLHELGFIIEMDDFGSGYSSLNSLKDIPVDVLKLDMKFLSHGGIGDRSDKILRAVLSMAKDMGMPVIAEGVQNKRQVNFLKEVGCEYVQGFLYSPPLPVSDFEHTLASQI